jgi:hypothetical protein
LAQSHLDQRDCQAQISQGDKNKKYPYLSWDRKEIEAAVSKYNASDCEGECAQEQEIVKQPHQQIPQSVVRCGNVLVLFD